jgi:hypothetical protein
LSSTTILYSIDATFKCGRCTDRDEPTYFQCVDRITEHELIETESASNNTVSTDAEEIAVSSVEPVCSGHMLQVKQHPVNKDSNYFERRDNPEKESNSSTPLNWTVDFIVNQRPKNQADVLKIWDTVRNLQGHLNNQSHAGISPRIFINSSMVSLPKLVIAFLVVLLPYY